MKRNRIDKRRLLFSHLCSAIYCDVEDIKELSLLTEQALKKEYKSIIARANKPNTDGLSEFDKQFIAECYAEDIGKVQDIFPRILRYSLFITAMSNLEGDIVSLCRGSKQLFLILEDFNVKAPNVINRGIDYLKKHVGITTDKYMHYIDLTENYKRVRNCIVHSEGDVSERDDEPLLRKFISEIPTLAIDRYNRIIIHEGFVNNSIHSTQLLLNRILDSIKEKVDCPTKVSS